MITIIMGVSGCGKTTIGELLAEALDVVFYDADDFHPEVNVQKMSNGQPLNDEDRKPWLENLANNMIMWEANGGAVLSCSALKESYRILLNKDKDYVKWVYLSGSYDLIKSRMETRKNHFMKASLLQSQFDALEIPNYGIHVSIADNPTIIIKNILLKMNKEMKKSDFGVIGLGVMGKSLSLNIAEKGHTIAVYNRMAAGEETIVPDFLTKNQNFTNLSGYTDLEAFVGALTMPRKILLMIKAGAAVDKVLETITPLLSAGDIVIDGGNSHYEDTERRVKLLEKNGLHFIGSGVSGGEEGARKGPSIMPGGNKEAYQLVAPILESIAAKDSTGASCCTFIGNGGAGHFIKMVHNGIEYAEMQLLAEQYAILSKQMTYEEIANLFETWNEGNLSSYLLEITINILRKKEGDHYLLSLILDKAGNKSTGSWSTQAALNLGIPNTMMSDAVFARYISSFKEKRISLAEHNPASHQNELKITHQTAENAYRFARIINHHQGFVLMQQASTAYDWQLNLSEIARIWTNGCIIRSSFMQQAIEWFKTKDELLQQESIIATLYSLEKDVQKMLNHGLATRTPLPVLSSAYQYWIAMTSEHLPANMIQAQRDYFGAHTYQRTDDTENQFFHTEW